MENNFDFSYFNSLSIKERVSYCKSAFGKKLGEGGSRIVFRYDSDKVLKIPKNKYGVAQNLGEITEYRRLADPTMLLPKIYDCDSDNWSYILCEYARGMSDEEFFEKTGCSNRWMFREIIKGYLNKGIIPENKLVADFCERIKNSGIEVRNDFMRRANIGIRSTENGEKIIVIDCGVNKRMYDYLDTLYSQNKVKKCIGTWIGINIVIVYIILFPFIRLSTKLYKRIFRKNVIK